MRVAGGEVVKIGVSCEGGREKRAKSISPRNGHPWKADTG